MRTACARGNNNLVVLSFTQQNFELRADGLEPCVNPIGIERLACPVDEPGPRCALAQAVTSASARASMAAEASTVQRPHKASLTTSPSRSVENSGPSAKFITPVPLCAR
jgi:hypothetical protein